MLKSDFLEGEVLVGQRSRPPFSMIFTSTSLNRQHGLPARAGPGKMPGLPEYQACWKEAWL
jgi:hypothetical protein